MSNNSNRNNNNRRRGRGNNRSQGGGGQLNRIDSRARGNAPQLLEKYKKLAHDCALNGDRVQAEYYLQFADHYFRVIADSRVQKDDPRGPRREFEREPGDEQDYFEDEFDRGQRQEPRRREEPVVGENVEDGAEEGRRASEGPEYQAEEVAAENPFTRGGRTGKPRRNNRRDRPEAEDDDLGNRLDPSALPGAIGRDERLEEPPLEEPEAEQPVEEERAEEAKPASRRGLKPRSRARRTNNDDEELEAVG